jgi:hypothetical protein
MLESEWRTAVLEMAELHGWELLFNIPDQAYMELMNALMPFNPVTKRREPKSRQAIATMHALKAWPDLLLGNRQLGRAIALELKTQKNYPDKDQRAKLQQLNECGIVAGVWKPRQHDELDELLTSGW